MTKFMKKTAAFLLCGILAISCAISASAATAADNSANPLKNSIGSVTGDDGAGTATGYDETQNKRTEYSTTVDGSTSTSESKTDTCTVYATKASSYTVRIPKTIILKGNDTKDGAYQVSVKGDISGNQTITIAPPANLTLKEQNAGTSPKDDVTATITQSKSTWNRSEITENTFAVQAGSVAATGITAGSWKGTFDFTVKIAEA